MDYKFLLSFLLIAATALVLILLRKLIFRLLYRTAKKTNTSIDDLLLEGLEGPSALLIVALALYISIRLSGLPDAYMVYAVKGMYLSLMLTVTMGLANISGRLLAFFLKQAELPISVTGLLNAVAKVIVYAVGILMMLNFVGISITPIITAMGVGGLAMALALQDTLSNLFAGIHILAEHTIRVGDYIRLENGQEGTVVDISWRTTRIRMQQNTMIIVPNSKLSQSVVVNYSLPEKRTAAQMQISVSYDTEPAKVEQALLDELQKAVGRVRGLIGEPAPHVRFLPGFGPSSLDFTLIYYVDDPLELQPVSHELHLRILRRFKQDGIEIPYPTRALIVKEPSIIPKT